MDNNNTWNEFSFRRYKNRNNERELDFYEKDKYTIDDLEYIYNEKYTPIDNNGVYEDLTLENCRGVEDWWDIKEEYN